MAITATQIESSNSLEQFRQQFNNLQSDVTGLETGTLSFSTITTTSQNTTTLNVREDGTIIFKAQTIGTDNTTIDNTIPDEGILFGSGLTVGYTVATVVLANIFFA